MAMTPVYTFPSGERDELYTTLAMVAENPYTHYPDFRKSIVELATGDSFPRALRDACARMCEQRESGAARAHVLRHCPVDDNLPLLVLCPAFSLTAS
jgi:hypothetical protein